jgi:hypothetical protein
VARFVAKRLQRRVQKLVDVAVERLLDFGAAARVQLWQLIEEPRQLLIAERLPALSQALNDRAGRAVVQLGHEPLRFFLNNV